MSEKPIIFSSEMVRAILDGRKKQTRRVIKPQPEFVWGCGVRHSDPDYFSAHVRFPGGHQPDPWIHCPYGKPGDQLWVRESFQIVEPHGSVGDEWIGDDIMEIDGRLGKEKPKALDGWWSILYKADTPDIEIWWRPSIYMPRWASRIVLEITATRVERLQDISSDDAYDEGYPKLHQAWKIMWPRDWFQKYWDSLNAKRGYPWESNSWVWVIEFKRLEQT